MKIKIWLKIIGFLSDDKIHDSAFVELVNNKIHEYYEEQNIVIDHDRTLL